MLCYLKFFLLKYFILCLPNNLFLFFIFRKWKLISFTNGKDIFYSTSCITKISFTPKCSCSKQIRTFINIFNPDAGNTKKVYKEKKLIG